MITFDFIVGPSFSCQSQTADEVFRIGPYYRPTLSFVRCSIIVLDLLENDGLLQVRPRDLENRSGGPVLLPDGM
uniref:hypothetical protein n=1 Tax=Brachybacterium tyrofermentans TaxID=47848 RepID=UPI003FD38580